MSPTGARSSCRSIRTPEGFQTIAPDVCVEILTPSNRRSELHEKSIEYFQFSVRIVWVIDPEDRTITIYRSAEQGHLYHEAAEFEGGRPLAAISVSDERVVRVNATANRFASPFPFSLFRFWAENL